MNDDAMGTGQLLVGLGLTALAVVGVLAGAQALEEPLARSLLPQVCRFACPWFLYPMFISAVLIVSIVVAIRVAGRLLHAMLGADRAPAFARRLTAPMMVEVALVAMALLSGVRAISANFGCAACDTGDWHVLVGGPLIDVYTYGALALLWLPVALVLHVRQGNTRRVPDGDRPLDRFLAGASTRPVATSWSTDVRKHPPAGDSD